MAITDDAAPITSPAAGQDRYARRGRRVRITALLVAFGVIAMLALGWFVDTIASAPPSHPQPSGVWEQAGLDRVSLGYAPAPLKAGKDETFTLMVKDGSGAPLTHAQVVCDFTMPDMFMPANRHEARESAQGVYVCATRLEGAGRWTLSASIGTLHEPPVSAQFDLYAQ